MDKSELMEKIEKALYDEADNQDGYAMGEVLSGNVVKENSYRGAAAGLRMAAGIVVEQIQKS